jgi:hypothetical protein
MECCTLCRQPYRRCILCYVCSNLPPAWEHRKYRLYANTTVCAYPTRALARISACEFYVKPLWGYIKLVGGMSRLNDNFVSHRLLKIHFGKSQTATQVPSDGDVPSRMLSRAYTRTEYVCLPEQNAPDPRQAEEEVRHRSGRRGFRQRR